MGENHGGDGDASARESRRSLLKKAGMIGGAAWVVPAVLSVNVPMAAASPGVPPVFKGQVQASANFGSTALTISNLNSLFAVGDYMLAEIVIRVSTSKDALIATPAGWTVVAGPVRSAATGNDSIRGYVFGRRFQAGDTAVTFTKSDPGNPTSSSGVVLGYSGVNAVTPIGASSAAANSASPATATAISTTAAAQKVVFLAGGYQNNGWGLPTAGWGTFTQRAQGPDLADNPDIFVADATKPTAGSTGAISSTVTASPNTRLVSFLVALNP